MKFRAKMQDVLYMREFQAIVATISKLSKDCVMILGKDRMNFIVNENHSSTSSPLVWASIASKDYFPEYKMNPAKPEEQDFIVLTMSASHLSAALSVLRNSTTSTVRSCKIKLQRIQFPCISVITSVISPSTSQCRDVVHNVPAAVIPVDDWPAYVLPKVPVAQIVLGLPSLRLMRSLIEKLKNISPYLVFHGTAAGELNLVAESDMATITTCFRHLLPYPTKNTTNRTQVEEQSDASCSVDSRKASNFFGALQLPHDEIIIGIDREHCIYLQLDIRNNITLHSILPAICI